MQALDIFLKHNLKHKKRDYVSSKTQSLSNHILLFDTKKEANVFSAKVCTLRESKLKDLARKASVSITFSKRCGLFNDILLYKFRVTFWIMPVLAALYFWIMSHYIWCVEIVGNSSISTEYLIEFINDAGIGYGALKDSIDEALSTIIKPNIAKIKINFFIFS